MVKLSPNDTNNKLIAVYMYLGGTSDLFNCTRTSLNNSYFVCGTFALGGGRREVESHMKRSDMLILSRRSINHRFCSCLAIGEGQIMQQPYH